MWIKFVYERNSYVVNLSRISSFVRAENGWLTFWLPDAQTQITINPKSNPDAYEQILGYFEDKTG
ncbi:MAG: hypothetical protein WA919_22060 [Coleofasciculaceae cyanobacterium]